MELENYYWCFRGAIPNRICDDIVEYGLMCENNKECDGYELLPEEL